MHPEVAERLRRRTRLLWFIFAGFAFAVLAYLGAGAFIIGTGAPPPPAEGGSAVRTILLAVAVLLFPALRMAERRIFAADELRKRFPHRDFELVVRFLQQVYPVLWAIAEVPALFGVVLGVLGSDRDVLYLLCGISLFYLAVFAPVFSRLRERVEPVL